MTQNHRKNTSRVALGLEGRWERRAKRYDSTGVEDTHIPQCHWLQRDGGGRWFTTDPEDFSHPSMMGAAAGVP